MRAFTKKNDREIAHQYFDLLWKRKLMTRSEAYQWLAQAMNLTAKEGHIKMLSTSQCMTLVELVVEYLNDPMVTIPSYVKARKEEQLLKEQRRAQRQSNRT